MDRRTFAVTVERDANTLLVRIPELPQQAFGVADRVDQIEDVARDVIARWANLPEDSFDVTVTRRPASYPWSTVRRRKGA